MGGCPMEGCPIEAGPMGGLFHRRLGVDAAACCGRIADTRAKLVIIYAYLRRCPKTHEARHSLFL
jgi:hypothetical protein